MAQAADKIPGHHSSETTRDSQDKMPSIEYSDHHRLFEKLWTSSTEDNLSLYAFRRFKTTHLLNLRLLEEEISQIDHQIYQTGLNLGVGPTSADRLGLKHCKRDKNALRPEELIEENMKLKLRDLIRQYGECNTPMRTSINFTYYIADDGLAAFNRIMAMETCSMIDDERQSHLRTDLSLHEIYKTRLVRVDLGPRTLQDPFQRTIHKWCRWLRYWRLSARSPPDNEGGAQVHTSRDRATQKWSYQNTVQVANAVWRVVVALAANTFIIVPLAMLSHQSRKTTQLITVAVWIVVFSFLVAGFFKGSNQATIALIAAYAAVLSVFISGGLASYSG
jgi:hypothetical protein